MNLAAQPANNSPMLAIDPREPRFVVMANRLDSPAFGCALQISGDGGARWSTVQPVPRMPQGADQCYAPEVAFDAKGVLYFLFVGLEGAGNEPMGAFLTTSSDRAQSFAAPWPVLGPFNFGVRMAIDPTLGRQGRVHLVWLHATSDPPLGGFGAPPNPIMAAYSDDGGRTFSPAVQVSDPGRARVVAPALALGAGHRVHVAYYDLMGDAVDYQGLEGPTWQEPWSVVTATSLDAGRQFLPGTVVDDGVIPPERVMLVFTMPPPAIVAHRKGRVCVAWTDARHGDADALLRCSPGHERSWEAVRRLNDDTLGSGARQLLPRLSVSPSGRVDAVFLDRRHDPENLRNNLMYSFSTDGGRSFSPNVRVSSETSDSRVGQQYVNVSARGQYEFGTRLGLFSLDHRALAAWPDTRNSRAGPGATAQDLFSAHIELRGHDSGRRRLSGLAVLVAGVTIFASGLRMAVRARTDSTL